MVSTDFTGQLLYAGGQTHGDFAYKAMIKVEYDGAMMEVGQEHDNFIMAIFL